MAWMAMMGANSIDYHRATIVERGDDHAGRALSYYGSRGETPLVWGGYGAPRLGLLDTVTDAQYSAIFAVGGAQDPTAPGWSILGGQAWSWSYRRTSQWPSWA